MFESKAREAIIELEKQLAQLNKGDILVLFGGEVLWFVLAVGPTAGSVCLSRGMETSVHTEFFNCLYNHVDKIIKVDDPEWLPALKKFLDIGQEEKPAEEAETKP